MKSFLVFLFIIIHSFTFSQGSIEGVIYNSDSIAIPFANITLHQNDSIILGTSSDIDGFYKISNVEEGLYSLRVLCVGTVELNVEVNIVKSEIFYKAVYLKYHPPLYCGPTLMFTPYIFFGNPYYAYSIFRKKSVLTSIDINELKIKNIDKLISTYSGITNDKEGRLSFKGNRPENVKYYIDGVPIIGKPNIPSSAIDEIIIYNNGTPARF